MTQHYIEAGQISPAAITFNHLKACRYGHMLYNIHDVYVGRSLDLYGEFSEGEVGLFRRLVKPGDLVLDVGANIGPHTLFFSPRDCATAPLPPLAPHPPVSPTLCTTHPTIHTP